MDELIRKMWDIYISHIFTHTHTHTHTHTRILFGHEKEGNPALCDNMDEPWGHYATLNKSDRERQILYILTYMQNLKKLNS